MLCDKRLKANQSSICCKCVGLYWLRKRRSREIDSWARNTEGALDSTLIREASARKQTKIMAYQILMILKVAPYSGLNCWDTNRLEYLMRTGQCSMMAQRMLRRVTTDPRVPTGATLDSDDRLETLFVALVIVDSGVSSPDSVETLVVEEPSPPCTVYPGRSEIHTMELTISVSLNSSALIALGISSTISSISGSLTPWAACASAISSFSRSKTA